MAQTHMIRKAEYQYRICTSDNMVHNIKALSVKNILQH